MYNLFGKIDWVPKKNNNNVNDLTAYVVFSGVGFELQTRYNTFYTTCVIRVVLITYKKRRGNPGMVTTHIKQPYNI